MLHVMELIWGNIASTADRKKHLSQDTLNTCNIIKLSKSDEYCMEPEKRPTPDALLICKAIKSGKLMEYWSWLEKTPVEKIIGKFLGIIDSKSSGLPIIFDEELSSVNIKGISFDRVQNVQARMMTKINLLVLVESESKKLKIWDQIQLRWTKKYITEIKTYVQIIDAIVKQCENSRQIDKAICLRNSIKLIKETNRRFAIEW
jgi:hypothetical protein